MGKRGLSGLARFLPSLEETEIQPVAKEEPLKTSKAASKYDATGLVPHYASADDVPAHLQKYYAQRYRYFSLEGCLLDEEGWYSVTPERIACQIAERCRCDTILDAFCGVGGNAIQFATVCERVIALDTSPTRLALARHNAQIYGVADRIEFILGDYLSFAESYDSSRGIIDAVFLSPPWGGPEYLSPEPIAGAESEYTLAAVKPIHGAQLFDLTRRKITKNIAYYLPRNTSLQEISQLVEQNGKDKQEYVEVEEEWMGNKLKALTCYFGELVGGES